MPKKITAYQAADGSIHEDECGAAKRDLEAIVQASPMAENAPYAKMLVEWLTDRADVVLKVLAAYHEACPRNVAVGKAPMESGEGPVAQREPPGEFEDGA